MSAWVLSKAASQCLHLCPQVLAFMYWMKLHKITVRLIIDSLLVEGVASQTLGYFPTFLLMVEALRILPACSSCLCHKEALQSYRKNLASLLRLLFLSKIQAEEKHLRKGKGLLGLKTMSALPVTQSSSGEAQPKGQICGSQNFENYSFQV